jgi:hypothetical protein
LSIPTAPGLVQVRPEEGGPSDDVASTAFCVTVSTLQWPAVFSMEDPDSDELYVNLRPELGSERSIESTAVRYVRVES